jgi:hypothetical protein
VKWMMKAFKATIIDIFILVHFTSLFWAGLKMLIQKIRIWLDTRKKIENHKADEKLEER